MKRNLLLILFACIISLSSNAQLQREEMIIPDIEGYVTLKGDFHIHTVFSDGYVWPSTRVWEAWQEGLDVIAITDHLEYLPHKDYVEADHNNAYNLAKKDADKMGILLIQATEITKSMPPGHFNALFVKDASKILNDDYMKALEEAFNQNAFVMWNHPGWKPQAPEGIKWMEEHKELFQKGYFKGIEVANYNEFYPEVIDWVKEKDLTIFSNSDVHETMGLYMKSLHQDFRPLTLVFAKEKTEEAVREAFDNGRTLGLYDHTIMGKEDLAKELFYACVEVAEPHYTDYETDYVMITNNSSIDFKLTRVEGENTNGDKEIILPAGTSSVIKFNATEERAQYKVENIHIASTERLIVSLF